MSHSLLDIHKYSYNAFEHLYNGLQKIKNKKGYINKDDPIASVTGVIYDITEGDEEIVKIIKKMDEIDKIKSQKAKTRLEKITESWLKKAYFNSLNKGYIVSRNLFLNFVKNIMKPKTDEEDKRLTYSSTKLFEKINAIIRNKKQRLFRSKKLDKLKKDFPNLNIQDAYLYAMITEKFKLKQDDIDNFERIVRLLISSKKEG